LAVPAAGFRALELVAGFLGGAVEAGVELDVCAHTAAVSASAIPAAAFSLSFAAALRFMPIY